MPTPEIREVEVEVLPKEDGHPTRGPGHGAPGGPALNDPLIAFVARVMDSIFTVPGTKIRFGLDPILGLLPVVGSPASAMVSIFLLTRSAQHGVPNFVLARMAMNVVINAILDEIPVIGDGISIFFRSNKLNYELLQKHAGTRQPSTWKDRLFVAALLGAVGLFMLCALIGFFLIAAKLFHWVTG